MLTVLMVLVNIFALTVNQIAPYMMPTHHHLNVQALKKSYNNQLILEGINFSAEPGSITALLGESGAGKTTLLRCLNLLDRPDEGSLSIAGLDFPLSRIKKKLDRRLLLTLRQKVGIVFQQFYLWEHMRVIDNLIEAPRQVLKLSKVEAIDNARALLQQLGILEQEQAYPRQL